MPAYLIARVCIHDAETYQQYAARSPAIIAAFAGRVLARGPAVEVLEGDGAGIRVVIVEFPSVEAARRFYHSPQYQEIRRIRAAIAEAEVLIVETLPAH
jgi:uncharacterized protein (DUF1330 family)